MPTIAKPDSILKNPLHWYAVDCDSCEWWRELSGPYPAGTDEDVKAVEHCDRSLEQHASTNKGHRTTLYMRVDNLVVRTFIHQADDFQQEMVRS